MRLFLDCAQDKTDHSFQDPENEIIEIRDPELLHHLSSVRRMRKKESILFAQGKYHGSAEIIEINKGGIILKKNRTLLNIPKKYKTILFLGASRPSAMELGIKMATEAGVDEIFLFKAERTGAFMPDFKRLKRYQKIIYEAAMQCERLNLPEITLIDWPKSCKNKEYHGFLMDPYKSRNIQEIGVISGDIGIAIGPEGGFGLKDMEKLQDLGFIPINMSPNILRVETACAIAVAWANWKNIHKDD